MSMTVFPPFPAGLYLPWSGAKKNPRTDFFRSGDFPFLSLDPLMHSCPRRCIFPSGRSSDLPTLLAAFPFLIETVTREAKRVPFHHEKGGITAAGPFPIFKGFPNWLNMSTRIKNTDNRMRKKCQLLFYPLCKPCCCKSQGCPRSKASNGEAVVFYCEPLATKEMGHHRLFFRVKHMTHFLFVLEVTKRLFANHA